MYILCVLEVGIITNSSTDFVGLLSALNEVVSVKLLDQGLVLPIPRFVLSLLLLSIIITTSSWSWAMAVPGPSPSVTCSMITTEQIS